jgi:hypothetical protein
MARSFKSWTARNSPAVARRDARQLGSPKSEAVQGFHVHEQAKPDKTGACGENDRQKQSVRLALARLQTRDSGKGS